MDKSAIDWSNLTPEQSAILQQIVVNKQDDGDDYAAKIKREAVAEAKAEFIKEFGPYISASTGYTAMAKLTEGLSDKAKADIIEKLKDKPVDQIAYLAEDESYRAMLRDSAEYRVAKVTEATQPQTIERGEGTQTDTTQEVKEFQSQMSKMGATFTDAEAERAIADLKKQEAFI